MDDLVKTAENLRLKHFSQFARKKSFQRNLKKNQAYTIFVPSDDAISDSIRTSGYTFSSFFFFFFSVDYWTFLTLFSTFTFIFNFSFFFKFISYFTCLVRFSQSCEWVYRIVSRGPRSTELQRFCTHPGIQICISRCQDPCKQIPEWGKLTAIK